MKEHDYLILREAQQHWINLRRAFDMRFDFVELPPYLPETKTNLKKALALQEEYLTHIVDNSRCDHFMPDGECAINAGGVSYKYSWCSICGQGNYNDELEGASNEYRKRCQREPSQTDGDSR